MKKGRAPKFGEESSLPSIGFEYMIATIVPGLEVLVPYPMNVMLLVFALLCGIYLMFEK